MLTAIQLEGTIRTGHNSFDAIHHMRTHRFTTWLSLAREPRSVVPKQKATHQREREDIITRRQISLQTRPQRHQHNCQDRDRSSHWWCMEYSTFHSHDGHAPRSRYVNNQNPTLYGK